MLLKKYSYRSLEPIIIVVSSEITSVCLISCICEHNQCNSLNNKLFILVMSITLNHVLEIQHKSIMEGDSCFEARILLAKEIHLDVLQFDEYIQPVISKSNQELRY